MEQPIRDKLAIVLPNQNDFDKNLFGNIVSLHSINNGNGVVVSLTNYGARIVSLCTPDRFGNKANIVLGYNTLNEYLDSREPYFGATIGRCANRISNACFGLDTKTIQLTRNKGVDHLHGGINGFHAAVWDVVSSSNDQVVFSHISKDGEEGYPGNLHVQVSYKLNEKNELIIHYTASTDKKTIINLTNHSFFNLSGAGNPSVGEHLIQINADYFLPINNKLLPTGGINPVIGTQHDFRTEKSIGIDWDAKNEQIILADGFDHTFVLKKNTDSLLSFAARVTDPNSGRILEVETTEPGVQFYTGNALTGTDIGREGVPYIKRSAFCLETQHFPDSPNQPNYPSVILEPGKQYDSTTIYRFQI